MKSNLPGDTNKSHRFQSPLSPLCFPAGTSLSIPKGQAGMGGAPSISQLFALDCDAPYFGSHCPRENLRNTVDLSQETQADAFSIA